MNNCLLSVNLGESVLRVLFSYWEEGRRALDTKQKTEHQQRFAQHPQHLAPLHQSHLPPPHHLPPLQHPQDRPQPNGVLHDEIPDKSHPTETNPTKEDDTTTTSNATNPSADKSSTTTHNSTNSTSIAHSANLPNNTNIAHSSNIANSATLTNSSISNSTATLTNSSTLKNSTNGQNFTNPNNNNDDKTTPRDQVCLEVLWLRVCVCAFVIHDVQFRNKYKTNAINSYRNCLC